MNIARILTLLALLTVGVGASAQTIQGDLPDSVIAKLQCKKIWDIIDASRLKFKAIRGARKPLKYSEVYASRKNPKGINYGEITIDGRSSQYYAVVSKTANYKEAAKAYGKFLPVIEICLEGWIFETEPESEDQIARFKAHEKEDMSSGITVELIYRKIKHGQFIVELIIQP
jgi:hypothetical protein